MSCPGAGLGFPWRGVRFRSAGGSILWVKKGRRGACASGRTLRARRCGPDAAPCFEGSGIWGGLRREPAGNRGLGATGWGYAGVGMEEGRLPRSGRVGGVGRCGSLAVRDVSFGGAWPGSRVRYDEGGRSGRFRLGGLGLVQSRRDDGRVTAPSVMAVDIWGLSCRWPHRSSALRSRVRAAGRVESSGPGDSQGS